MEDGNLIFVGIVSIEYEHVVASCPRTLPRGTAALVDEGLQAVYQDAAETTANKSIKKLQLDYHTVYYQTDDATNDAVVVMIYDECYPQRLVYAIVHDVRKEFKNLHPLEPDFDAEPYALQQELSAQLARIFERYEDVDEVDETLNVRAVKSASHCAQTQLKVHDTTQIIGGVMQQIMSDTADIQELKSRSTALKKKASVVLSTMTRSNHPLAAEQRNRFETSIWAVVGVAPGLVGDYVVGGHADDGLVSEVLCGVKGKRGLTGADHNLALRGLEVPLQCGLPEVSALSCEAEPTFRRRFVRLYSFRRSHVTGLLAEELVQRDAGEGHAEQGNEHPKESRADGIRLFERLEGDVEEKALENGLQNNARALAAADLAKCGTRRVGPTCGSCTNPGTVHHVPARNKHNSNLAVPAHPPGVLVAVVVRELVHVEVREQVALAGREAEHGGLQALGLGHGRAAAALQHTVLHLEHRADGEGLLGAAELGAAVEEVGEHRRVGQLGHQVAARKGDVALDVDGAQQVEREEGVLDRGGGGLDRELKHREVSHAQRLDEQEGIREVVCFHLGDGELRHKTVVPEVGLCHQTEALAGAADDAGSPLHLVAGRVDVAGHGARFDVVRDHATGEAAVDDVGDAVDLALVVP
ncbi:synaptobrevin homolog YKT6, putative [Babesia caballi]|uniref:Synaptobrevin homolog YKT6, putative n=1 Tax=Babesia caballi TaxID=5871 RepID=A0AAV4M026_BABCB|nr:synaptobrevin homolog YKT6, putative [Babesia caballi]